MPAIPPIKADAPTATAPAATTAPVIIPPVVTVPRRAPEIVATVAIGPGTVANTVADATAPIPALTPPAQLHI